MENNSQDFLFPGPHLPVSGNLPARLGGHKTALAIALTAAAAVALFMWVPWTLAVIGAVTVLVLSAIENEAFLLLIIFLFPLGWVLPVGIPIRNVPIILRWLVVIGFFTGRLLRGQSHLGDLFRPLVSRASLLFFCAAIVPTLMGMGQLTYPFVRKAYDLGIFVGFYFLILAWVDSRERLHKVSWTILCSTATTAGFALYQQVVGGYTSLWYFLYPPDNSFPDSSFEDWSGRSASFLHHPNLLAAYLNIVLPFALACYLLGRGKWKKAGACTFGMGLLALLSTQSIGGIVAFVAILALAIFRFIQSRKKQLVFFVAMGVLLFASYSVREVLNPAHTEEYIGSDVVTRYLLWSTAWGEFTQSPVFGVGWGNFAAPFGWDIPDLPGLLGAHNLWLQVLAETGLVGFLALCYLLRQGWKEAMNRWRSSNDFLELALAFGVLGALVSLMTHGFVDFPLDEQIASLFWVIMGLLVASGRFSAKPNATPFQISSGTGQLAM